MGHLAPLEIRTINETPVLRQEADKRKTAAEYHVITLFREPPFVGLKFDPLFCGEFSEPVTRLKLVENRIFLMHQLSVSIYRSSTAGAFGGYQQDFKTFEILVLTLDDNFIFDI